MKINRKEHMDFVLKRCNLDVFTYSPGDGITRYKFAPKGLYEDYFAAEPRTQALGWKEAMVWLDGYEQALLNHKLNGEKL